MPSCSKCSKTSELVACTPVISGAGSLPSILELAYMVNLEYYADIKYDCIHEIPENTKAKIKISEMVEFLENRKWELVTRTNHKGICLKFNRRL